MGAAVSQNHVAGVDVDGAVPPRIVRDPELSDDAKDRRRSAPLVLPSKQIAIAGNVRAWVVGSGARPNHVTDGGVFQTAQPGRRIREIAGDLLCAVTGALKDSGCDQFVGHGDEVLPGLTQRPASALRNIDGGWKPLIVIARPRDEGNADLLLVVQAGDALRSRLGPG